MRRNQRMLSVSTNFTRNVKPPPTPDASNGLFYKTKMCRFYALGTCHKGSCCPYAHGKGELNPVPDLSRTKVCKTLMSTGSCNDPDCRYAHSKEEMRTFSIGKKRLGGSTKPAGARNPEGLNRDDQLRGSRRFDNDGFLAEMMSPDQTCVSSLFTPPASPTCVPIGDSPPKRIGQLVEPGPCSPSFSDSSDQFRSEGTAGVFPAASMSWLPLYQIQPNQPVALTPIGVPVVGNGSQSTSPIFTWSNMVPLVSSEDLRLEDKGSSDSETKSDSSSPPGNASSRGGPHGVQDEYVSLPEDDDAEPCSPTPFYQQRVVPQPMPGCFYSRAVGRD